MRLAPCQIHTGCTMGLTLSRWFPKKIYSMSPSTTPPRPCPSWRPTMPKIRGPHSGLRIFSRPPEVSLAEVSDFSTTAGCSLETSQEPFGHPTDLSPS